MTNFDDLFSRSMSISNKFLNAADRARELGTYNCMDRSRQYEPDSHASNRELLKSLNEAFLKIRRLERTADEKDAQILSLGKQVKIYRVANMALISVITGVCWEGVKALGQYVIPMVQQLLHS